MRATINTFLHDSIARVHSEQPFIFPFHYSTLIFQKADKKMLLNDYEIRYT